MIDFFPVIYYADLYINICLVIVLFTILHTYAVSIDDKKNIVFINVMGYFLLFFFILYIGLRPIDGVFGDTVNYNVSYSNYIMGAQIKKVNDLGWHMFMKASSNIMSVHGFFTICSYLYIFPLYKISKKLFNKYWYYAFLMFIVSFSFYSYGVNGVRNGAALSLFLWGLSFKEKKIIMFLMFFIAIMFHKTTILPISAYLITYYYNKPKIFLTIWLSCIPLSLILGSLWISLFTSLGFGDDRLNGYLNSQSEQGTFASTGFRWDFLIYGGSAVFSGWYFIFKKNFKDQFYFRLLNTYLICNGFWILIIRANFSNRFAYLSWFMMAIVIIYPLLKQTFFKNQHIVIGKIIFAYFTFTYFMYLV